MASFDEKLAHGRQVSVKLREAIGQVIVGQSEVVEQTLWGLVAGGHVLLEGAPGLGKTLLVRTLAHCLELAFGRIQFTPDLMPSDIVGTNILVTDDRGERRFSLSKGPVFTQVLLADEINRATPKTQSALLEAMEEKQVTIEGETRPLPTPFFVIATQNPHDQLGTFALPESQLDRFLMRISVGYPSPEWELQILETHGDHDALADISPVITIAQVERLAAAAREVHVAPGLKSYLVDLASASRRHPYLALGMSPRATLALQRVARARAASQGRNYVLPDDLKALAEPVLTHRLLVTPEAQLQGITAADALAEVLHKVPVPLGSTKSK